MDDDNRTSFLVLRAQAGERVAIDELLKRFQAPLHHFLTQILREPNDADDALQATFLQVFRKLKYLRNPAAFRPWLWQIASRSGRKLIRSRRRHRTLTTEEELIESVDNASTRFDVTEELKERLPSLLQHLSQNCREVILLHYLEQFTLPEVAAILEIPLGTVKSRLAYALTCLRRQIQ